MVYRRFFGENQPLHIISRAVEERKIFAINDDCLRFIFQIYAANFGRPAFNLWKKDVVKVAKSLLGGEEVSSKFIKKEHPPLVHIVDFSLVLTHNHFYLVSAINKGASFFMQKLNTGFAKFFNFKYSRSGALFGSRYRCIPIETEFQSNAVSRYVSIVNPLDIFQPGWRENGLKNQEEALKFLENYPFSSFPDKIRKRASKVIAPQEVLEKYSFFSGMSKDEVIKFVEDFLKQNLSSAGQPFLVE